MDIDRGYAWFVLAGAFVMYMLILGSTKSFGILYTEMKDYFGSGSGATAWIGSLSLFLLLGTGSLFSWLTIKYSFRKVGVIGGVLTGLGFALCVFVSKMEYMFITFGLTVGLGYGLTFTSCVTIVSFYFEKNRALANGIMASASGIATFTLPFLYRYLIDKYTLKGTFLILGAIMLHICPAACIFTQPDTLRNSKSDTDSNGGETRKATRNCGPRIKISLFRKPLFTLYVLAFTLCNMGFANTLILIPSYTKDLGYDTTKVSLSVSIMGGFEVGARILVGWFADRNIIKRKYIFMISMVIGSVFSFITPQFESFWGVAVYAAIVGIFPGSFWSLVSVMIIDAVGIEHFVRAFGLATLCIAFGFLLSQPVAGWLEDITGSWDASFYLTGCLFLLAGLIVTLEPVINAISDHLHHDKPKVTDQEAVNEITNDYPNSLQVPTSNFDEYENEMFNTPHRSRTLRRSTKTDDTSIANPSELAPRTRKEDL